MKKRLPLRARCPYCGTIVTGKQVGRTIYGYGCRDADRCVAKAEKEPDKRKRYSRFQSGSKHGPALRCLSSIGSLA